MAHLGLSGTRTASSFLDISASNTGTDGINLGVSYYGAGNYGPLKFVTGGSERARIDTSGRLLINTTNGVELVSGVGGGKPKSQQNRQPIKRPELDVYWTSRS